MAQTNFQPFVTHTHAFQQISEAALLKELACQQR